MVDCTLPLKWECSHWITPWEGEDGRDTNRLCSHCWVTQVRAHTHRNETVIFLFFFFLQSTLSIQTKPDSSMASHKVSPVCIADMHILRDRWSCNNHFESDLSKVTLGGFFLPVVSVSITTLGHFELTFHKARLRHIFSSVSLKNLVAFVHLKPVLYTLSH